MTAELRQIYGDERRARRQRRGLVLTIVAAGAATGATLLLEVLPVGAWLEVLAACVTALSLAASGRAIVLLGREDRRRMRAAEDTVDLIGSMVLVIDRDFRIRLANPAACRVFGRAEDELLGRVLADAVFTPADRVRSHEAFAGILEGRIETRGYRSVREVLRPDGGRRVVSWHLAARHDERGRLDTLLISGEDVTDARSREAERAQERRDLEQLHRLAQEVAASDDARQAVVERIRSLLDASFAGLAEPLDDGSGDWWYSTCSAGFEPGQRLAANATSGSLLAARTASTLFVGDAEADGRVSRPMVRQTGVRSMLFQPVFEGDRVVAVITAGWLEGAERLDERKEQVMGLAAVEAAIALQRRASLAALHDAALTDALTGAANRRAFDVELERALARSARSGERLALALIDLNAFKALNDQHGHDRGDVVLASCAGAWRDELRQGDVLARLGGDEFAVILPGCDAASGQRLAARLRQVTPHVAGASIGIVASQGEPARELYRAADRALYADKAAGRARRLADPERLAAVHATGLWEAGTSPALDRLVAEASAELALPGVYITLVGEERLSYAAKPPSDPESGRLLARSHCHEVVTSGRSVVVTGSNATACGAADGPPLAYAGSPIADDRGLVIGVLCACDDHPRDWSARDLRALDEYADRASRQLGGAPQHA